MAPRLRAFGEPALDPTAVEDVAGWYRAEREERAPAQDDVPERTWRDLEGDALFRALDHTLSPLGRQRLYARLREPDDADQRVLVEAVAHRCAESPAFRDAVRQALTPLRGTGGYRLWQLIRADDLIEGWVRWAPAVTLTLLLLAVAALWVPKLLIVLIPFASVGVAVRLLGLSRIGAYIGPLRELAPVLRCARALHAAVDRAELPAASRTALQATLRPPGVSLSGVARAARLVSPPLIASNDVVASVFEYLNLLLLLDVNALVLVSRSLRRHRRELDALCRAIGLLDVGYAVASFRQTRAWCYPVLAADSTTLTFEELVHPTLPDGVANDVRLERGMGLLLTGANMSGKSTLLRALGANVLMGRALNTCTATAASLPCTRVFTSIGHTDDLERGISYFLAEAETIAGLMRAAADQRGLFLLDELFRGTNAAERLAAAEMVLRALVTSGPTPTGQFVAIATHDLQLGDLLADCFVPAHLAVETDGDHLAFHYRLTDGPARSRTALTLLRRLGVSETLIDAAIVRARQLER